MSETLRPDLSRAEQFQAQHVYLRTDYDTYLTDMLSQWKVEANAAKEAGETIKPLWLRRTDDMGSEFGAVVDYVMPLHDGLRYFAAIYIDGSGGQTDISIMLPNDDGSGEPVIVKSEAYTLPALQRAIELVETQVQPAHQ